MKHKNKSLLLPSILNYMCSLDDLSYDEIDYAVSLLDTSELRKLESYKIAISDNFTIKRLFIFICWLIDQKELYNLRIKNKNKHILP